LELRALAHRIVIEGTPSPAPVFARPARAPRPARQVPADGPVTSRLASNPKLRPTLEKFVSRLENRLEAMEASLAERDFEALAGHAHWLKGAGGTVGFDVFTGPAEVLEQLAREGKANEIDATLAELRGLADRIELGSSA